MLKPGVEVPPVPSGVLSPDGVDFFNQLREVVLYLIGLRTDLAFCRSHSRVFLNSPERSPFTM